MSSAWLPTPGTRFNLFLATATGASASLEAAVLDAGTSLASVTSIADRPLLDSPSGVVTIPASGSLTVRVRGSVGTNASSMGPYRLLAYLVNPGVEGGSSMLPAANSVITGAIEQYGDVDEFTFTLPASRLVGLALNPGGELAPLALAIDDAPVGAIRAQTSSDALRWLGPWSHTLRVAGASALPGGSRGRYQLLMAIVDSLPENAGRQVAVGDTISELGEWPLDVDVFDLSGVGGDTLVATVIDSGSGSDRARFEMTEGSYDGDRVDLVPGAAVHFRVLSLFTAGWAPGARRSYRLAITRRTAAPEHRSPLIAFGDTVRDAHDGRGDLDIFELHGPAGAAVVLEPVGPTGFGYVQHEVLDPASRAIIATTGLGSFGFPKVGALATFPASGTLLVRVCDTPGCVSDPDDAGGAYGFVPLRIDSLPEHARFQLAVGDTVSEDLVHPHDVDIFSFQASASERVQVGLLFQSLPGIPHFGAGLHLDLVDLATDGVISTIDANGVLVGGGEGTTTLLLPRTGSYALRISVPGVLKYEYGPYRLRLVDAPVPWRRAEPAECRGTLRRVPNSIGPDRLSRPDASPRAACDSESPSG